VGPVLARLHVRELAGRVTSGQASGRHAGTMAGMPEERRLVTVLFADVVGSTSLGESLDPEDVRGLLGRLFALAEDVIGAHGGTLEKFIGDAIFAVFGMPQAHGDDPERALSAAIELRDRARADEVLRERLPIRLGINTGEVVAAADHSRGDFLIVGDAVNVAARLQQAAEPWEILCSERTARAAGTAFSLGPPIDKAVRGRDVAVTAHVVLARASARPRRRTPIVGRESDLAQLQLIAHRAFTERRPFLVSVTALPGIGKSRLIQEFVERLDAPAARVAFAQCLPYGQRLTYWPLRGLLLEMLGLDDQVGGGELLRELEGWLRDGNAPKPAETARVIAATIGVGDEEVSDVTRLQEAWLALIAVAAHREPVLIVIEDIHWASDSLLDLLEHLIQPRAELPLLVVALARPELLERRRAWGAGRRNYVSLALEALRQDEVVAVVSQLLERDDPTIAALAVERGDGNPLFIGEIVRAVVERGGARELPQMPDTVQGIVLARLDLLDAASRRLLQVGSVFGRSFRGQGIVAVEPNLSADFPALANALLERDLIDVARGETYTFRHIMVREVAYATLPRVERARLHRRAADWLAGQAGGRESELAELIALHYREAATLFRATSERDAEIDSAAVAWLSRAAEAAAAAAAQLEASHHLLSAIGLARPDQQPELHAALADALGVGDRAAEEYVTAARLGREQGRDADFQLRNLAMALQVYGRWFASVARQPSRDELDRLRDEARALLSAASDQRARATFEAAEGFLSYWVRNLGLEPRPGENAAAEASARRALVTAERLADDGLTSASLDALAAVVQAERPHEAAALQRRRLALSGLTIAERSDAYYTNLWLLALLGRLDDAVDLAGEALDATETIRRHPFSLGIGAWGIYALALLGRWDEVSAWAPREHARWVDADRPSAAFVLQGFYSALAVARARRDEQLASVSRDAFEEIVRAYDATQPTSALLAIATLDVERLVHGMLENRHRYPSERAYHVEHVLSLVTDRRATVPEALLKDMVVDSQRIGLPVLEAEARRALGVSTSDPGHLSEALEIFERLSASPRLARVQVELGGLIQDPALVDRGVATLERLGDLEHLTRIGRGAVT